MIRCKLQDLLNDLPETQKVAETDDTEAVAQSGLSLRAHARNADMGWQQFSGLLHNNTRRPSIANLQKLRDYLATTGVVTPGTVEFKLDAILDNRGLTRSGVADAIGISSSTVNRMANNLMIQVNYVIMEKLCVYLELSSLEDLLDTGGLLVWEK